MLKLGMSEIKREAFTLQNACKNCNSHCELCKSVDNCLYFLGSELKVNNLTIEDIIEVITTKVITM